MKRYGNLYQKICDLDNIMLAFENATKGKKSKYKETKRLKEHQLEVCKNIKFLLETKTYYITKESYKRVVKNKNNAGGKKERIINKLSLSPHRIVQWAIMQVLEPIFLKNFCYHTCSCVPNGGIKRAWKLMVKALEDVEGTTYCLKIDVRKFYDSIPHSVLKEKLRKKFKDPDLLWLLDQIIDSFETTEGRGLALGSYFSQYAANFLLSDLDHYLKEKAGVKYATRYMDDYTILHHDKEYLHSLLKTIDTMLKELGLELKGNYQIFPVEDRGVDFVGYVFRHNGNIKLRKSSKMRLRALVNKVEKQGYVTDQQFSALNSFIGFFPFYNSKEIFDTYIADILPLLCDHYNTNIGAGDKKKLSGYKRKVCEKRF